MKRLLDRAGASLLAAGLTSVLGYVIATQVVSGKYPAWPYWLFTVLGLVGLIMFLAGQEGRARGGAAVEHQRAEPTAGSSESADDEQIRQPEHMSDSDPIHPLGVGIYARSLRNEKSGTIRAEGPGSFVNLIADDIVNAGTVSADQNGRGTRLADHLRVVAGHIADDAAEWDRRSADDQRDGTFAAQYVRYGRGRQAGELYDSAVKAGLVPAIAKAVFECATTVDEADRVVSELVRWADELDRRRS